jgi:hypothetical protein
VQRFASYLEEQKVLRRNEIILLAIVRLERAQSGEILNYIKSDLTHFEIKISKRTLQYGLTDLERSGLIKRNKQNICELTDKGRDVHLFARSFGEQNVYRLFALPLPYVDEKALDELIERFGFLIIWHFFLVVWGKKRGSYKGMDNAFIVSRVQNSIPIIQMFDVFMKQFSKIVKDKRDFPYEMILKRRQKMEGYLRKTYPKYYAIMAESTKEFLMSELKRDQDEALAILGDFFRRNSNRSSRIARRKTRNAGKTAIAR